MARDTEVGSVTVGVVPDASGIEQKLKDQIVPAAERVGDEAGNEMSDAIEKKMTEGGDKSASRFEKSFKTRLKKALDNLPEAKIDGDVTNVERKIQEVRAEIKNLHDQPLIDKGEAARAIDQVMLRVAALRAEAAGGIEIPVDIDTQSALADFETAITKIRGKAITGALVPGGMFSRIPFSGSVTDKVLAAAQQKAAAAAAPSMADIFVEAQALQFARDQASVTKRAASFAHIPLAMGEIVQNVTGIGTARAKMFASGPGGIADVIQGVIREAMPASPYGEAGFVAGVEGIQKAVFSMSKEVELFRKPVGDIVKYSDNMATNSEEFGRLLKEIAPSPTFGFGYRDLGGRRVWAGQSAERAFRGMGVPGGLLHDPGLGGYLGGARFAASTDAIHDFSDQFSKDLVKFEKPMGEIVKYTANLNGTGQALIRMSDLIEQSDFSHLSKGDTFFKKMTDAITRGFRAGRQGVASRLRGIVSRRGTAAFPEDSGISEDVVSSIEARLRSGVPITGELTRFAQFLKSDAAKSLGTPGTVTPGIIDAMEKRLTTGVPLTGELNRFARYIRLDALKGVRRSLEDLIPMYGAGGGDVQKLLAEFGGGHKAADTATLLKAFGAGGGDLEKLLGMFGGGGGGAGGAASTAGGGGLFSSLADMIGPQGLAIGGGIAALSPFIGQLLAGAGVGIGGSALAGLGIGGAIHGLSNAATPAQIQAAQIQQAMATAQTAAAQDRLNKLMKSGKATAADLALAHMAVTAAQANQASAGKDLANLMKNRITPEQQKMKDAFGGLSTNVSKSMTKIGQSFVPVLTDLANTTSHVVTVLTPVLTTAEGIISKALKPFLDAIVNSFGTPAVQKAIIAIANAFAKILTAVTPEVGPAMTTIANSLADMANTVAKNPQAMANVFTYIMNIVNFLIRATDDLAKFANIIETWHGGIIGQTIAGLVGFGGGPVGPGAGGKNQQPGGGPGGLPSLPGIKLPGPGQPGAGPTFKLPGTPGKSYMSYITDWIGSAVGGIPATFAAIGNKINIGGWFAKAVPEITKFGKTFGKAMDVAWQGVDLAGKSARHNIAGHFDEIRHDTSHWFATSRGWVATESVKMWNGMLDGLGIAWRAVHDFFTITVPANVKGWFKNATTWLNQAGHDVIDGLFQGMKDFVNGGGQWIHDNVIQPLINIVTGKTFGFAISSPAKKMVPIGKQIVEGIVQGMMSEGGKVGKFVAKVFGGWPGAIMNFISRGLDPSKLVGKAASMFQGLIGGVGTAAKAGAGFISKAWNFISGHGGASQWAGTVSKALTMLGLNQNLSGLVLRQIQSESGGNPNAINLTDINAKHGDPSRGLLQTIGSTFAKWHVAGTSWNIYDPLANIAAALNYAKHGRGIGTGKYQLGSGGPYDQGGWLPPGVTMAINNTGKPERVLTADQFTALGSGQGPTYVAHFDGLTGQAIHAEVRTAFHMMSFTQGQLDRPGRRS